MPRDPYGPKAKPTPPLRPAVTAPTDEPDEQTKERCCVCETGLVLPEINATVRRGLEAIGEKE